MTALFMEGFDHYGSAAGLDPFAGTTNMKAGTWDQVDANYRITKPTWGDARTGPWCLRQDGVGTARKVLEVNSTKLICSVAFAIDIIPPNENNKIAIVDIRDENNVVKYGVGITPAGQLCLYSGQKAAIISTTAGSVIQPQTWHFIECIFDTVAGTFQLKLDDPTGGGTPILTGAIATGFNIRQFGLARYDQTAPNCFYDDVFIRNGAGSINNSWAGDRRIATLLPNRDTTETDWPPEYYHCFGPGILRCAYRIPTSNDIQEPNSFLYTQDMTNLDLEDEDFTLEAMVRFDALPLTNEASTFFATWDSDNSKMSYRLFLGGQTTNGGNLQFDVCTDGTAGTITTIFQQPWTPVTNQWYHLAISRSADQFYVFINGAQLGVTVPLTEDLYNGGTGTAVGCQSRQFSIYQFPIPGTGHVGRFDEVRYTLGTARYTAPFAPPTEAFPTDGDDPDWADVQLLCPFDDGLQDVSAANRVMAVNGSGFAGAIWQPVNDGPQAGIYSTVNKLVPDDNTFISAPLQNALGVLTATDNFTDGETVTVGTDGTDPAVYKFVDTLVDPFDVKIGGTYQISLQNLIAAINLDGGEGVLYGTGTLINADVTAILLPSDQMQVEALIAGLSGNDIESTTTAADASWADPTLTGGTSIPGPTAFKFQRPPSNTTVISALQTVVRAFKTDSGLGTIQTSFIGPLGGVTEGVEHPLAISPDFYSDIIETDPDTDGPLSPTAIINGKYQIQRTV